MPENSALVPMETLVFEPNTFIALDLAARESETGDLTTRRIVGTVITSDLNKVVLLAAAGVTGRENTEVVIPRQAITAGWWAPMGYRP